MLVGSAATAHEPSCAQTAVLQSDLVHAGRAVRGFRAYRLQERMWDIVTPVFVSDAHVGNVFAGQFFYDDEEPDMVFLRPGREVGFDRDEYMRCLTLTPARYARYVGRADRR